MPPYSQTTLASAAAQLAVSLRDPASSYWSLSEKYNAIRESLRMMQSMTGIYRQRVVFPTVSGQAFYDLRTLLPTEYPFTITDDDLLAEIEAHLLEPVTNPWTGTDQFNLTAIASAMNNVRDQYLLDSGVYITRATQGASPSANGRVQLPQSTIDVRRAGWQDSSTLDTFALIRTDEYATNSYSAGWQQQGDLPYQYSVAVTPPVSLQLVPPPSNAGTLDLCTTNSGPTLNLNPSSPVQLGVPNDLCWGIKWGTLEQLLSADGDVRDPVRARAAGELYNLAVSLGRSPLTTFLVSVGDVQVPVMSIDDFDRYSPDWQNQSGEPTMAALVGANLLALASVADAVYSVTMDMAIAFPVPVLTTDYLQVGAELISAVLDMAQHICCFKMGGAELQASLVLRENFLKTCALLNGRLRSNAFFNLLLDQPASRQDYQIPRSMPRSPEEINA